MIMSPFLIPSKSHPAGVVTLATVTMVNVEEVLTAAFFTGVKALPGPPMVAHMPWGVEIAMASLLSIFMLESTIEQSENVIKLDAGKLSQSLRYKGCRS